MGAKKNTVLPEITARMAARTATSVFPNPTSPYINRSIGTLSDRSLFISLRAESWSAVSSKRKLFSSCSIKYPPST